MNSQYCTMVMGISLSLVGGIGVCEQSCSGISKILLVGHVLSIFLRFFWHWGNSFVIHKTFSDSCRFKIDFCNYPAHDVCSFVHSEISGKFASSMHSWSSKYRKNGSTERAYLHLSRKLQLRVRFDILCSYESSGWSSQMKISLPCRSIFCLRCLSMNALTWTQLFMNWSFRISHPCAHRNQNQTLLNVKNISWRIHYSTRFYHRVILLGLGVAAFSWTRRGIIFMDQAWHRLHGLGVASS